MPKQSDEAADVIDEPVVDPGNESGQEPDPTKPAKPEEFLYVHRSLFIFTPENPVRRLCLQLIDSSRFNNFILLCIMANALLMGLADYKYVNAEYEPVARGSVLHTDTPELDYSWRNDLLHVCELPFLGIFTFELVVKVIAIGFCTGKRSYVTDAWNWLDFLVVCSGLLMTMSQYLPKGSLPVSKNND
jgi:hypothetical protein